MHNISICCTFSPARRGCCCSSDISFGFLKEASICRIECAFDIGIDHPGAGGVRPGQTEHFFDGVGTSSTRAKPVTDPFEASFPKRFQGRFLPSLGTPIDKWGNAKPAFSVP